MRWLASFPLVLACVASGPVKAQPLSHTGVPVMARVAHVDAPTAAAKAQPCRLSHLASDSVRAASARLFMAAHTQAALSEAEAVRALLVAISIESACTNAVHN